MFGQAARLPSQATSQTRQATASRPAKERVGCGAHRSCTCAAQKGRGASSCSASRVSKLQAELLIGDDNDVLELEADRVSRAVLTGPERSDGMRAPVAIQRSANSSSNGLTAVPARVDRVLTESGSPLEPSLRADMEGRFGRDFSQVRVHVGTTADVSAKEVSAKAFTVANHVVFADGRFEPASYDGRRLLAHELTHVVQQSSAPHDPQRMRLSRVPAPNDRTTSAPAQDQGQVIRRNFSASLSSDPGTALVEEMAIVESIRPLEGVSGAFQIMANGAVCPITDSERDQIRGQARRNLLDNLTRVRLTAESARDRYDAQHRINEDQWLVSGAVHLFGGIDDPGPAVAQHTQAALAGIGEVRASIDQGAFVQAARKLLELDRAAQEARVESQRYVASLISTAEGTATVLTGVAIVAGVTVLAIGTILAGPYVLAGARAGALALALTTAPVVETAAVSAPVALVEASAVAAPAIAAPIVAAPAVALPAAAVPAVAVPAVAAPVAGSSVLSTATAVGIGVGAVTTLSSDEPPSRDDDKRRSPCDVARYGALVCSAGEQAHHIVADYTLRYGSRADGVAGRMRIDGLPSFRDGPAICLQGHRTVEGDQHNIAHGADEAIELLGANHSPRGAAPISRITAISIAGATQARPACGTEIAAGVAQEPSLLSDTLARTTLLPPYRWPLA